MIPITRLEGDLALSDEIRVAVRAGRSPHEVIARAEALVSSWPESARPLPEVFDRLIGFHRELPLSVDPVAWKKNKEADPVVAPAFASERLLAERLAAGPLRRSMRYVPSGPDAGWRAWSSDCWPACPEPIPRQFAAEVHREVGSLLAAGLLDQRTARGMETTASMRGVLAQVCAYPEVQLDPSDIDPPGMLPTVGGVLDLEAGGTVTVGDPATCNYLRCAAVGYDSGAHHDAWDTVAEHVAAMPGGDVVQRFLGASLLGVPPDRKALFLVGDGGGGKGTLLRSCLAALGDFGTIIPTEALTGGGRGAHGHELLSGLTSARLGFTSELEGAVDWSAFKSLTGGDPRTSKRLHGRRLEYQPRVWLAIACNHAPRPPDGASRDRCIVVTWIKPVCPDGSIVALLAIPGPERNAYLRACLRWLVDGCREYQRDGLGVPDFARAELEPEGLAGWFDTQVEAGAIIVGRGVATFADLYADACRWAAEHGDEAPTEQAAGGFLGGRLAMKRRMVNGRKVATYTATIQVDGHGRASNRLPITCEIDGLEPVHARPSVDDLAEVALMPDPTVVLDDLAEIGAAP